MVYTGFDKIAVAGSFMIALIAIPFSTCVVYLSDILGVSTDFIGQMTYCIPSIMTLALAASICLRRKGYGKAGIVLLFISLLLFVGIMFI